jgi:tetratricopeptide (TPR) repeat protein
MRALTLLLAIPSLLAAQSGEELFQQRRFAEAKSAFQAELATNKNDANALFYMGRIVYAEGNSKEAVDWFERAVKHNEQSALYHHWLGSALGDEAQKASKFRQPFLARRVKGEFELAVKLDPKMIEPRRGLVDFYSIAPGVMGGSMDKAREQAAEIGKINAMQGHFAMARIAQRQKDLAVEERELKAARSAAPDSVSPYYTLASFYRRQSKWDDAFALYDSLMAAKPDEKPVRATYGIVAAMSGKNLERGERELKLYLDHPPTDLNAQTLSVVRFRLGQIYEQTARKELARAEYAEAVKQNPQNQDAKKALEALK